MEGWQPPLMVLVKNNPIVPGAIIVEKVIQGLSELETPKEVITLITIKFNKVK
jgi:hypothetical protein